MLRVDVDKIDQWFRNWFHPIWFLKRLFRMRADHDMERAYRLGWRYWWHLYNDTVDAMVYDAGHYKKQNEKIAELTNEVAALKAQLNDVGGSHDAN